MFFICFLQYWLATWPNGLVIDFYSKFTSWSNSIMSLRNDACTTGYHYCFYSEPPKILSCSLIYWGLVCYCFVSIAVAYSKYYVWFFETSFGQVLIEHPWVSTIIEYSYCFTQIPQKHCHVPFYGVLMCYCFVFIVISMVTHFTFNLSNFFLQDLK